RPPMAPLSPYTTLFRSQIWRAGAAAARDPIREAGEERDRQRLVGIVGRRAPAIDQAGQVGGGAPDRARCRRIERAAVAGAERVEDRKSTRLNSSHVKIS